MKIAIVSDMHIGYERFYEDAYQQALRAMESAHEKADMVIIPGDVFDKRAPKPEVMAQAVNIFMEMSRRKWPSKVVEVRGPEQARTDAPIIAIPGTHERTAEGKENPLKVLALAGLLVDASESTVIVQKGDEKVAVFGLGGLSEERVKPGLEELNPKPVDGAFNVFMFHQSTFEILPFSKEFIHNDDLPVGFDLYVDGHIHNKVEGTVHGKPFLIPGSTVLTQLKDKEQGRKGYILFDTQSRTHQFIEIDTRPFIFREIMATNAKPGEISDLCEREISQAINSHTTKPILRIQLTGTIAKGFTNSDMPLHALQLKHADELFLEIDHSKLQAADLQKDIEQLRENKLGDMPIRDLGMRMFAEQLREKGLGGELPVQELFNILSSAPNKEKAIKEAGSLLLGE
ncbi:MAG: metallophosphoesterase family protein [Candidatus Micrarchaeota archaeon]|nr:metallophosphoesterase family protein [Candidatus Micrarchaeota archaeon]